MHAFSFLQSSPVVFIFTVFLLGLAVGSFLNVVILRLPIMLESGWKAECQALMGEEDNGSSTGPKFNLITPGSHCPKCEDPIRAWQNIPVISYLMLGGKCSHCKTHISARYPAVELLTALISAGAAWHFGYGTQAAAAIFLGWALIALTFIDFDHQLLPDNIVLPVLWLGILLNTNELFAGLQESVFGAAAGYLSLWILYHLFKLITGKEGMGHGDFKLFALFGAWLGWQYLPLIILLSSVVGAAVGIFLIITQGREKNIPIPFVPYLAAAGWIALIWGEQIISSYLQFAKVS